MRVSHKQRCAWRCATALTGGVTLQGVALRRGTARRGGVSGARRGTHLAGDAIGRSTRARQRAARQGAARTWVRSSVARAPREMTRTHSHLGGPRARHGNTRGSQRARRERARGTRANDTRERTHGRLCARALMHSHKRDRHERARARARARERETRARDRENTRDITTRETQEGAHHPVVRAVGVTRGAGAGDSVKSSNLPRSTRARRKCERARHET